MREMSNIFAGIGTMIITSKYFYRISNVINTLLFIVFAFSLTSFKDNDRNLCPDSVEDRTKSFAVWAMLTCLVSTISLFSFAHFAKGSTMSVTGHLVYAINSVQMLVLFFWTQAVVFKGDNWTCWDKSELSPFTL